jgi:hypothetical protein
VKNAKGVTKYKLHGAWTKSLTAISTTSNASPLKQLLWKRNPTLLDSPGFFNFTFLSMRLNVLNEKLQNVLPTTDSRFRPDQRALENAEWDKSDKLKCEVEIHQRKCRKELISAFNETGKPSGPEVKGISIGEDWWVPRWFRREFDPDSKTEYWKFTNEYCMIYIFYQRET